MVKRFLRTTMLALPLLVVCMGVKALPIGLGLIIDGSGSISAANFAIQKSGYIAALNNVLPADGSVAS